MIDNPGRFGSPLRWHEASRDIWGWRWLDDLRHDIRYALRSLVAHKAFSATAVIALALGIGATTAIFSVVSTLVFRPLPFAAPDRLVQIRGSSPLRANRGCRSTTAKRPARGLGSFETIVGYDAGARYLKRGGAVERVMTVRADGGFFDMLGVPPLRGRTVGANDTTGVVVISGGVLARAPERRPVGARNDADARRSAGDDRRHHACLVSVSVPRRLAPVGSRVRSPNRFLAATRAGHPANQPHWQRYRPVEARCLVRPRPRVS